MADSQKTRQIARRLGRRMLARMLRSEIGEVYNRGAWADASLVTPAVIELYKAPLRTRGWDAAIIEVRAMCQAAVAHVVAPRPGPLLASPRIGCSLQVTRARKVGRRRMQESFQAVEHLPSLVVTGAKDRHGADLP